MENNNLQVYEQAALQNRDRQSSQDNQEDEINFGKLLSTLSNYKGTIISVFLIFLITSIIATLLVRPQYTAKSVIEINPQKASSIKFDTVDQQQVAKADEYIRTQVSVLKSNSVALDVAKTLKLYDEAEFNGEESQRGIKATIKSVINAFQNKTGVESAADDTYTAENNFLMRFNKKLSVNPERRSYMLRVSYTSFDPELSADIVNSVIKAYIKSDNQKRFNSSSSAKKFLESEIADVQARLEKSERDLTERARVGGIVDLENGDNVAKQRLTELGSRLAETQASRIEAQTKLYAAKQSSIDGLPEVITQSTVSSLKARLSSLNAEYDEQLKIFKPSYPSMQQLAAKIEEVESGLAKEKQDIISSISSNYSRLKQQESLLTKAVKAQEEKILNLKDKSVSYNILKREWETNRQLYKGLLERMKEVSVMSGMEKNTASVIDVARVPMGPSSPNLLLNSMIGSLLGLMSGLGLAFFLNFMDKRVKNIDDLELLVKLPSLGLVPHIEVAENSSLDMESIVSPSGVCAEAYRSVRTSLMYSTAKGLPKSLMVTSSTGAEGKSSASINLSIALARNGSKVLLVDADLRKPRLHKVFSVPSGPGLTETLVSEERPNIYSVNQVENLDFMPSGVRPPNPAEILGSSRVTEFVDALSNDYDVILFDSCPILGLADAVAMSTRVDGVIYMVAGDKSDREMVKRSVSRLKSVNATILGTVLNNVDVNDGRSPYLYYQYQYGELNKSVEQAS